MKSNLKSNILQQVQYLKKSIKKTLYSNNHYQDNQQYYNIVFGVDSDFILHACITIRSLIAHIHEGQVHFYLITAEDISHIKNSLLSIITGTIHIIHVYHLPKKLFTSLPSTQLFSKAIYYRLLAPYLLENEATILYLDADIVCLNIFTNFYNSRLATTDIALVVSEKEDLAPKLASNIGLQGSRYFNSGMLLINVQRWLQENISDKTILILESEGHTFKYMDQDALNITLEGKVKFVEKKYNLIFMLGHQEIDNKIMPATDTVFLHYAGADKPWQKWNKQAGAMFYKNISDSLLWPLNCLDAPKNDDQAKKMYHLMFREKKYLSGVRWYFSYFMLRYSKLGIRIFK
ncbi:lipopolysaccharide 1,3-galactosyltransferase [Serratia symbiotica str. 'Cinara cedri']|nr:lipopolysaccharide 1,3-galactosyltransferase [Serratia symbiotica str. 'Cinara cedri']